MQRSSCRIHREGLKLTALNVINAAVAAAAVAAVVVQRHHYTHSNNSASCTMLQLYAQHST
eukprot:19574-Heterococcus_DN1.PRE.2